MSLLINKTYYIDTEVDTRREAKGAESLPPKERFYTNNFLQSQF